jgi:hypothetical protein
MRRKWDWVGFRDNKERNTTISKVCWRGAITEEESMAIATMMVSFETSVASTKTMHMAEGGTKEENGVQCLLLLHPLILLLLAQVLHALSYHHGCPATAVSGSRR